MSVQIGRNAGAQPVFNRMGRVKAHQHLMRNLRIARLIRTHQAQSVSAQQRHDSIKDEKHAEDHEDRGLAERRPGWQAHAPTIG